MNIFFLILLLDTDSDCVTKHYFLTFQKRLEGEECIDDQFFKDSRHVYLAFAIMVFMADWAVPVSCFFILYGMVVISMQRRKRDSQFESNR